MRVGSRGWRRIVSVIALGPSAVVAVGAFAGAASTNPTPGPKGDGTAVTPQGWAITPAGTQLDMGPWPQTVAASPDGRIVVVGNAGYSDHALSLVDTATRQITQTVLE